MINYNAYSSQYRVAFRLFQAYFCWFYFCIKYSIAWPYQYCDNVCICYCYSFVVYYCSCPSLLWATSTRWLHIYRFNTSSSSPLPPHTHTCRSKTCLFLQAEKAIYIVGEKGMTYFWVCYIFFSLYGSLHYSLSILLRIPFIFMYFTSQVFVEFFFAYVFIFIPYCVHLVQRYLTL